MAMNKFQQFGLRKGKNEYMYNFVYLTFILIVLYGYVQSLDKQVTNKLLFTEFGLARNH